MARIVHAIGFNQTFVIGAIPIKVLNFVTLATTHSPATKPDKSLSQIEAARSVDDLRTSLSAHYGNIDPRRLDKIIIVGAAPEGQRLAEICLARGIGIAAIVDDNPAMVGTTVHGVKVQRSAQLEGMDRAIPVVIASHRTLAVTDRIRKLGFAAVLPFAALQVLAPDVFKPHMFYDGWLEDLVENRDHYKWLNGILADDRSRDVLDAVIRYRLTGDPLVLAPIMDEGRHHQGLYHPVGVFECGDDEVYVDAGAFDGDSIRWFQDRVGNRYDRVIAFEPDPKTFARLKENFRGEDRVDLVNAGLHREKATLRFRDDASRGAIFVDDGDSSIEVVSLDDLLGEDRATLIKMNIEGAEIDALYGAQKTIRQWAPKLAISVYHRPSDLWRIPLIVRELNDKYNLFLRQHDGGVIETVLYAVPR